MRPFRFLLLLIIFVALPMALTCWSLFASVDNAADSFHPGYNTRSSRFTSLFSFSTPSSLFPPSAVISLTNDNSTFFLARPAAFGPSLPSNGLSGQLWVGKGFGDDSLLKEESIHVTGWELGCSDVPGWGESVHKHLQHSAPDRNKKKTAALPRDFPPNGRSADHTNDVSSSPSDNLPTTDDGTDDYLHHPLKDSNPATPGHLGEPANVDQADKTKQATHADIESLQESAAIAGKVVMLARGGCGFLEKVKWAQRRGGIAVIVGDNERGAQLTIMYAKGDTSNITVPALFTSYTSAHLLSSLVPPEDKDEVMIDSQKPSQSSAEKGSIQKPDDSKPVFTSTKPGSRQPTNVPVGDSVGNQPDEDKTWVKNVLSAIGLSENSPFSHAEDSRRPPSSGNIDWVLLEDWDDDHPVDSPNKPPSITVSDWDATPTPAPRAKSTTSRKIDSDDFVIGVQDWRDADLVAPLPTPGSTETVKKAKNVKDGAPETLNGIKPTSTPAATLKGGSITPGSGEYDHGSSDQASDLSQQRNRPARPQPNREDRPSQGEPSEGSWLDFFKPSEVNADASNEGTSRDSTADDHKVNGASSRKSGDEDNHEGLWVTLTPTSVSTNPFFDTLLVLVVSPLVTLTVVYALLLLRSRIRRRRWRAPKSVVERLPVRTYHTMTTTSSTTSSQIASPEAFSPTSPLLISTSQDISRRPTNPNRTRSQTTIGVFPSASVDGGLSRPTTRSSPAEKTASPSKITKRKRYTGRQVECVVCLEEYVDGESQVMSLPCGHEFHADCITPWLVTRRRTCPICKGDVVRSLARAGSARWEDEMLQEHTTDDVQSLVAETTNDEPSAAIPIPTRTEEDRIDDDVEQGRDIEEPLMGGSRDQQSDRHGERQSLWRNIVSASVSRLSGDTLWRQTPVDRNR
ncbi:uncharacterized protein A1O9_06182 [Exophiala aquamarina CBS 119918]|uniref:RING-type E3 ubiquitin transferase n=1 Tax=Exophiala aquamarina CBS 119918 TaxID=1182545 RepID=A0A072PEK6_9EURO|nr:uncharacterized protein A1O9_06182 [Exophiala aquamarina CBS 119918]KEF58256.1 hypothetical protein A1O9_06182 [Exophiala aquamarina CBS 119918]